MRFYPSPQEAYSGETAEAGNLPREPDYVFPMLGRHYYQSVVPQLGETLETRKFVLRERKIVLPKKRSTKTKKIAKRGVKKPRITVTRPSTPDEVERPPNSEVIDDIIFWDEHENLLYVEAVAFFGVEKGFVKFRKDIATRLDLQDHNCPVDNSNVWVVKRANARTVLANDGQRWKCFSLVFACKACLENKRLTECRISFQGFKYAMNKIGVGLRDFLLRIRDVKVSGNLSTGSAEADIDFGEERPLKLTRCPLLG
jgi:hypothetical protein